MYSSFTYYGNEEETTRNEPAASPSSDFNSRLILEVLVPLETRIFKTFEESIAIANMIVL